MGSKENVNIWTWIQEHEYCSEVGFSIGFKIFGHLLNKGVGNKGAFTCTIPNMLKAWSIAIPRVFWTEYLYRGSYMKRRYYKFNYKYKFINRFLQYDQYSSLTTKSDLSLHYNLTVTPDSKWFYTQFVSLMSA